ncbi:MAG TPA: ShlB/FhaC/HecB family hemolysin secretion/activation protein [Vineibacter sp.]|nr:ShlB/FhaC/HecB family hemolysin secretion/activation protein [Vineibacter sp.]
MLAIGAGGSISVYAQAPPVLQTPPQQLRPPPPPPEVPPGTIPAAPPGATEAPPGADKIFLTPSEIEVEGATVYPPAVIEALTRPLIGRRVAASEIFELARTIERKYRGDGYFLTSVAVPAQRAGDGKVKLRVVEGFISNVVVEGDIGAAAAQARRFLDNLVGRKPVNLRELERYLLLTEDMPGVSIRAVLRPGKEPHSSELVVQLKRDPWDLFAQVDNRGFKHTGSRQITVTAGANSFTPLAERLEGTFFTTLSREQNFGQVSWTNFIGSEGFRLRVYGGRGYVKPGGPLKATEYAGLITIAGFSGHYPVVRSRQFNLNAGAGFDRYDSDVEVIGGTLLNRTKLRVVRLTADANYRDGWNGITFGNIRLSEGLSRFGATKKGDLRLNRLDAEPAFRKINAEVSRLQGLYSTDWFALNLLGTVAGQYSRDILPANEKYFVGADRLGRGFYAGQVTGDKAVAATIELQFNVVIPNDDVGGGSITADSRERGTPVQLYGFYDHAKIWNNAPLDVPRLVARSLGGGARVNVLPTTTVEVEGVRRIDRDVDGPNAKRLDPWSIYLRLTTRL